MKIVMLNWDDPIRIGGGRSMQVADLCAALAERGHEVDHLDVRSPSSLRFRPGVDVIHAHGYQANLAAMVLASRYRRWRPALVATLHGWHRGTPRYRLLNTLERSSLPRFGAITVPSREMRELLPPAVRRRVHVVPNGVRPVQRPLTAGGQVSILWLGRLSPEKRPELAIEVFARARERANGLRLRIVGPAADRKLETDVRRRAAHFDGEVVVSGRLSSPWETGPVDVLLQTSRYEGLPRVVVEAMSARVPVVASDIGGNRDAVVHGVTGFLCAADDVAAHVDRMVELACSEQLRADMGRAAARRYEEDFRLDEMAARIEALYRRVLP